MFGSNVIESVLTGCNYVKSLTRIFESQPNDYCDDITFIKDLQRSLTEKKNMESSQRLLEQLQNKPLKPIEDFNSFIQLNCNSYRTFEYLNTFLEMVMLVETLIRSDREDYWDLHILKNSFQFLLLLM